jgi:putative SOS response-associated peptidase YedK
MECEQQREPHGELLRCQAGNGEPCEPPPGGKSPLRNLRDGRGGKQLKGRRSNGRPRHSPGVVINHSSSGFEQYACPNAMCGRYRLTAKERYLRDHFGLDEDPSWTPRWNIAPTQSVPVVRQDTVSAKRSFQLLRWGLIPSWAKDRSIAAKTINAVSETAADKPAFRDALRLRRCLIPADGFYEWQSSGPKQKQPFSIGMTNGSVFSFAGLWESWTDANGGVVETCTILTTKPNSLVADVHNRMPVILKPADYGLWLDTRVKNPALVSAYLEPFDAGLMKKYPVSTRVNRPENDDQECAQEVSIAVNQTLF